MFFTGTIRVYCRVRPFLSEQSNGQSTVDHIGENGSIMIVNPLKQGKDARRVFSFNKIFGTDVTQRKSFLIILELRYRTRHLFKDSICFLELFILISFLYTEHIYEDTQPLVRSVLDGYNVCIFAYGQTGSGKTYTMVCDYNSTVICHFDWLH